MRDLNELYSPEIKPNHDKPNFETVVEDC